MSSLSHTRWFFETNINAFAAAMRLGDLGTIGVHGMMVDMGEIEETTVAALGYNADGSYNPGLTGQTISPSSMVLGLTFARQLTDKFAFGLTAKFAREDLVESSASAIMFDFGLEVPNRFPQCQSVGSDAEFWTPKSNLRKRISRCRRP